MFAKLTLLIYIQLYILQISMQKGLKPLGSKILEDRISSKTFLLANNQVFNQKINQITLKTFQNVKDLGIFQHKNVPNSHTFYYQAGKYDSDMKNDIENYMIKELHHFYNNFDVSYCIVYNHSNFVDFLVFRGFMEQWPQHFFQRLRRVYITNSSIMVKIIQTFSFGAFYRLCDELFFKVDNLEQLKQIDVEVMRSIGQDPKKINNVNTSKIKLIENEIYGKKIDQYDLFTGKYPIIMLKLLARLTSRPEQLKLQGIFRKSCDSEELQKLQALIINKNWSGIQNEEDTLVICGCLKKILNNLKLPLFNYGIYKRIIDFEGGDELILTQQIVNKMQYVNKKVFILLIVFFTQYIIKQKEFNKMTAYNLSVVFSPCFFRPEQYDLKDLMYSGKFAKILITCFDRQNQIFQTEERQLAFNILQHLQKQSLNIS